MAAGVRNVDPQTSDPHFWEKLVGGVAGLLIGGGAAVRKLSKRAESKAQAAVVDWQMLIEALERNTQAVEKFAESNREEHEKTRELLQRVNESTRDRLTDLMTRVLTK
jgi:hypothetical protein